LRNKIAEHLMKQKHGKHQQVILGNLKQTEFLLPGNGSAVAWSNTSVKRIRRNTIRKK
jgi:hypothetical protein